MIAWQNTIRLAAVCAAITMASGPGLGQIAGPGVGVPAPPPEADTPVVNFTTAWSQPAVTAGGQVILAITMDIAEGWHVQPHDTKHDWQVPTTLKLTGLPGGVTYGDLQWPPTKPATYDAGNGPETFQFFKGRATIFIKLAVPQAMAEGTYPFQAEVNWQACDDVTCLFPETTVLPLTLEVLPAGVSLGETQPELFNTYRGGDAASTEIDFAFFGLDFSLDAGQRLAVWLLAALGGLLLNFTPCVLPLIPIKIMGLSRAAEHRGRALGLGLVMALGVLAFWLALGLVIAGVSGFSATNQLFQYPAFTIGVGVVIVLMAVGMMGLFTARLPQWVYKINPSQDTVVGSFGFGIMTAVLSTPCTAPFMGAAAAWAATQSTTLTLTTFGAIGGGMALPYVVLAASPRLVEKMPRTGPASELIKQVMGLLMVAAAAYFIGTGLAGLAVTPPDPPSKAYWWAVAGGVGAAGLWLAIRTLRIAGTPGKKAAWVTVGVVMLGLAGWVGTSFTASGPINWTYYTPQRLAEAKARGDVVVLDFTAEWCLNCHALEKAYLHREAVAARLNGPGVTPIKVDLTGQNTAGNELLTEMGRRSIPYLVVIGTDGEVVFASDAYTDRQVLDAIQEAGKPVAAAD